VSVLLLPFEAIIKRLVTCFGWVPCHHGMALSVVPDGGDGLEMWRVAACSLHERVIDTRCLSTPAVGRWANNTSPEGNLTCYKALHRTSYLRNGNGFEFWNKECQTFL
jgi:hypothetical protein